MQLDNNGRLNLHGNVAGAPLGTIHIGPEGGPVGALRGSIVFQAAQSGQDAMPANTCRVYYRPPYFVVQFYYNGAQYYLYATCVGQVNPNISWSMTTTPI